MAKTVEWRNRIVGYDTVEADQLLANPANWRIHPKAQQDALTGVLDDVGWVQEIIVNKTTGHVVDGHMRVAVAITRGESVPVKYVELSEAEEKLILATIDPISAMAVTDAEQLEALLADVNSDSAAVQQMLAELAADAGLYIEPEVTPDAGAQIDRAGELLQVWQVERGQLWTIPSKSGKGEHRLLCGDSTSADDVARVMGGECADLGLTDPPYGVKMDKGFSGAWGFGGTGKAIARRQYTDEWDQERPSQETFELIVGQSKQSIIWGGNFFADLLPQSAHWLVWDKLNTMPTFGDCELAWTNVDRKSVKKYTFEYNGLIGKEKERFHPTQKPVGLMVAMINDYTESAQTVFDAYLGSGTTLVACEQTGRLGRGLELEPKYCAVILQRLADMGLQPKLAE